MILSWCWPPRGEFLAKKFCSGFTGTWVPCSPCPFWLELFSRNPFALLYFSKFPLFQSLSNSLSSSAHHKGHEGWEILVEKKRRKKRHLLLIGGRTTATVVTEIKCLSRAEMRLHIKELLHSSFLAVSKRWREEKVTFLMLPFLVLSSLLNGTYCQISCFPGRKVLICKGPCVHENFFVPFLFFSVVLIADVTCTFCKYFNPDFPKHPKRARKKQETLPAVFFRCAHH